MPHHAATVTPVLRHLIGCIANFYRCKKPNTPSKQNSDMTRLCPSAADRGEYRQAAGVVTALIVTSN
jgi:hypothetical protein